MKSAVFLKKHGLNRARDVIKQASDYAVYFRDMDSVCSPNEVLYYLWWEGELITFDTEKLRWVKSIYHDDNKYILDQLCELSELKRLIYSHEFVEYMGGVDKAKRDADQLEKSARFMHCMSRVADISIEPVDENEIRGQAARLKKAIADVEACHPFLNKP